MKNLISFWNMLFIMMCSMSFVACSSDEDGAPSNLVGDWHGYSDKRSVYVTFNSDGTGTMEMTWESTTYKEARATFSYSVNGNEIVCNGLIAEASTTGDALQENFTTTFYLNGSILTGGKYTDIGSYYRLDGGGADDSQLNSPYKISKITYRDTESKLLTYKDGKLSTVSAKNGSTLIDIIFDYDKKTITQMGQNNSYYKNYSYTLNSSGNITQLVNTTENVTYTLSYNSDGYLIQINSTNLTGYYKNTATIDIAWSNGNLTSYTYQLKGTGGATLKYIFSYDRQQPNPGIAIQSFLYSGFLFDDIFYYTGMFGKNSKNIPSSFAWSTPVDDSTSKITTSYDKNGLPTAISYYARDLKFEYK